MNKLKECTIRQLSTMLEDNEQPKNGAKTDLIERVADGVVLG